MTTDYERTISEGLNHLRALRDDIRVRIHLGSMDAKDAWTSLEPQIDHVEQLAKDASHTASVALREALERVRAFSASLK